MRAVCFMCRQFPSGATGQPPKAGVLLPTKLDDFSDSVHGDPITYAQCEQIPMSL